MPTETAPPTVTTPPEPQVPVGQPRPAKKAVGTRKWLRWLRFVLMTLLLVLVIAAGVVATHLGAPWVRGPVCGLVFEMTGVHVDYADASLGASSFELRDLTVPSLPPDADLAPQLLRVERITATWRWGDLLTGDWRLTTLTVQEPALHVVVDAQWGDSLSRLLASLPEPDQPPVPLSKTLEDLRDGTAMAVDALRVRGLRARVSLRLPTGGTRELALGDVQLDGQVQLGAPKLVANLHGAPDAKGLSLTMLQGGRPALVPPEPPSQTQSVATLRALQHLWTHGGRLPLAFALDVELPTADSAMVKVGLSRKDSRSPLLDLQARATFQPGRRQVTAVLEQFGLLGETVVATGRAVLPDAGPGPTVESAEARLRLDPLLALVPAELASAVGRGWSALARLKNLRVAENPLASQLGGLLLQLDGDALEVKRGTQTARLQGMHVEVRIDPVGATMQGPETRLRLRVVAPIGRLSAADSATGERVEIQGLDAGLDTTAAAATEALRQAAGGVVPGLGALVGLDIAGHLKWAKLEAVAAAGEVTATQAGLEATAQVGPQGTQVRVRMPMRELAATVAVGSVRLTGWQARLDASGPAVLGAGVPQAGNFKLDAGLDVQGIEAAADGVAGVLSDVVLSLKTPGLHAQWTEPWQVGGSLSLEAKAASARVGGGPALRGLRAWAEVEKFQVDPRDPGQATALLRAGLQAGGSEGKARLDRTPDRLDWQVDATGQALGELLAALPLPPDLRSLAEWGRLGFAVRSQGQAKTPGGQLGAVKQDTTVEVRQLWTRQAGLAVGFPQATLRLQSEGVGLDQELQVTGTVASPRVGRWTGASRNDVVARVRYQPTEGKVAASGKLSSPSGPNLAFDVKMAPGQGDALDYAATADASALAGMLRLLPADVRDAVGLDARKLTAKVTASGSLPGGAALLRGDAGALVGAKGTHRVLLDIRGVRVEQPGVQVDLPSVQVEVDASLGASGVSADVRVTADELRADAGALHAELWSLKQTLAVRGPRSDGLGDLHITGDGKVRKLVQNAVPQWPAGELQWRFKARAEDLTALRLESASFEQPAAGVRVDLQGGVDLVPTARVRTVELDRSSATGEGATVDVALEPVPGRQSIALGGTLDLDVARLGEATQLLAGVGHIRVPFQIESGDLSVFRLTAALQFDGVDLSLNQGRTKIEGVRGDLPLVEDFVIGGVERVRLLGGGRTNAWSRWRYQDHQPFLTGAHYLGIRRMQHMGLVLGPLAGNARVDRNVLHLDQLEVSALQGQVTGQCIIDVDGRDTKVMFRGNGTGLKVPGHDERLDLHAAMTLLPGRMAVAGRIQLLRAGRSHLLMLLDLWDPYREDTRANQARMALQLGHPRQASMTFQNGFMDMSVELGGAAGVVSIDEIRGIPLGPLMQKYLAPLMDQFFGAAAATGSGSDKESPSP